MKPVSNWRDAYKWLSVQIAAAIVILPEVWATMPPDIKAMVPPEWEVTILQVLAVAMVLGRLKDQGSKQ